MNLRMPVGIEDFKEARESYYFVDKTDFICRLIDGHSKVMLFTRPRRFGKTLTMSMLEYFFSIDKATESKGLFAGMAVERTGAAYMDHQGRYPVIFISLKGVQNSTWTALYGAFRLLVQREFQKHRYLLDSDLLNEEDKVLCRKFISLSASEEEYQISLLSLSEYLCRYFGRKPIILVDEYDAPIQCAYEHGFYDEAISYFRVWFNNTLKTNDFLNFAVMTGVLRIAKESIFSGLNNLAVYSVLSNKYSDVFGFSADEVQQIADDTGIDDKFAEMKKWYDGYRFGGSEIYNPWSIINYIDNDCMPMPYWVHTSGNSILHELLPQADYLRIRSLQGLLDDRPIAVSLNENVIYGQLSREQSALYTLLLMTGYLTVQSSSSTSYNRYLLRIPNEEIKQVYSIEILNTLAEGIDQDSFDGLFDALLAGQKQDFEYRLQQILLHFVSAYDAANKESFYHGFMLGMTALFLNKQYTIESNRESGCGRFDIALFPKDIKATGVIMEFKTASSEEELQLRAREALTQIGSKNYTAEFHKRGIDKVWLYGISFWGKHVNVAMSE